MGMSFVDYRDVAALLVAIAEDPDREATHTGKRYPLTGPVAAPTAQIAGLMCP